MRNYKGKKLSYKQLGEICDRRQESLKSLRNTLRSLKKQDIYNSYSVFEQLAESEKYLSFIYIDKKGKIIGSTPTFREIFHF